jgi:hypothetical protein
MERLNSAGLRQSFGGLSLFDGNDEVGYRECQLTIRTVVRTERICRWIRSAHVDQIQIGNAYLRHPNSLVSPASPSSNRDHGTAQLIHRADGSFILAQMNRDRKTSQRPSHKRFIMNLPHTAHSPCIYS